MKVSGFITELDEFGGASLNTPKNCLALLGTKEERPYVLRVLQALKPAGIFNQSNFDAMVNVSEFAYLVESCVKALTAAGIFTQDNFEALVGAKGNGKEVVRCLIALNVAKILTPESRNAVVASQHAHELGCGLDLLNRPRLLDESHLDILVAAGKDAYTLAQTIIIEMTPLEIAAAMRRKLGGITGRTVEAAVDTTLPKRPSP